MLTRSRARERSMETASQSSASASQVSSLADSAPQEEFFPRKRPGRRKTAPPNTQWVCTMPEQLATAASELSFVSLRDPRTDSLRRFLLGAGEGVLCEVLQFAEEPRSWFIDNSVQTDGSLQMCTPIDPLFLALPYFIKAAKGGKFTTLDAILEDAACDSHRVLESCIPHSQLSFIADVKELPSTTVYRYSKERAIHWLQKKVSVLAASLKTQSVYAGAGSHSALLVRSAKASDTTREDYLRFAAGMITDYLPASVSEELEKLYQRSTTKATRKLEGDKEGPSEEEPPVKKTRRSEDDGGALVTSFNGQPLEDYTKFNSTPDSAATGKAGKMTASQRSLAQVDKTGMKSLTSFFSTSSKKTKKS